MIARNYYVVRLRVPGGGYSVCICSIAGNELSSEVTGHRQEMIPNFELDRSLTPFPENLGLLRNKLVTHVSNFDWFLGVIVKLRKATVSFLMSVCLSVCPHGTTLLPLDGLSWNLISENCLNICRLNSSFIKRITGILHEDLCTFMVISHSFLLKVRNAGDEICRENQNTHFMLRKFLLKSSRLCDNVEKCGWARQSTDDSITRPCRGVIWMLDNKSKNTETHS